jgi:hypothetical protein
MALHKYGHVKRKGRQTSRLKRHDEDENLLLPKQEEKVEKVPWGTGRFIESLGSQQ